MTSSQFADEIGIQRSSMSHVLTGRNKPSLEFVQRILKRFPEVDTNWLLFGTGAMIKLQTSPNVNTNEKTTIEEWTEKSMPISEQDLFSTMEQKQEDKFPTKENPTSFTKSENTNIEGTVKKEEITNEFITTPLELREGLSLKEENDRKVKKIILFYSDQTFEEFLKG